ncbi:MAG TPA: 5'/3'-nucleotidase SurE, partial [Armatimonadota bacterium]|nr:5'/3'-nucleotidase SurE [Armatimonadota bacterium]
MILLTNDDGVRAEGLVRLAEALDGLGAIHVVAPDRQRSAIGHAITLDTPLKVEEVALSAGLRALACSGTPTDCVMVAVHGLLPALPDLVVSGINHGANMGEDLTYSGTVSAAM